MIGRLALLVAAIVSALAAAAAGIWAARRPGRPSSPGRPSAGSGKGGPGRSAGGSPTTSSPAGADARAASGTKHNQRSESAGTPDADDLRAIKGIGAVSADRLRKAGITSVTQIAAWSDDDVDTIGAAIKVSPERIRREDWVGQARAATS